MFAHIEGTLSDKQAGELVIDAHGVGYQLLCSAATVAAAPAQGERMRCYTHFSVREDAMELFGFATREERAMFRKLMSVSGIGARTALSILSAISLRELAIALVTGDVTMLARAPGIGKKTAQRMVLELKDKVEQQDVSAGGQDIASIAAPEIGAAQEAVQALLALGFSSAEANRAINLVRDQAEQTGELVRLALRTLGGAR